MPGKVIQLFVYNFTTYCKQSFGTQWMTLCHVLISKKSRRSNTWIDLGQIRGQFYGNKISCILQKKKMQNPAAKSDDLLHYLTEHHSKVYFLLNDMNSIFFFHYTNRYLISVLEGNYFTIPLIWNRNYNQNMYVFKYCT